MIIFLISIFLLLVAFLLANICLYTYVYFPYLSKKERSKFVFVENGDVIPLSKHTRVLFGDLLPMSQTTEKWIETQIESLKQTGFVLVSFFSAWSSITNNPKVILEVHNKPEETVDRITSRGVFNMLMGSSILVASGEDWKRQHRILQKAFTPTNISKFFPLMIDSLPRFFSGLDETMKKNGKVDLQQYIGELAIELIVKAGFASDQQDTKLLMKDFQNLRSQFSNPLWKLPFFEKLNIIPYVKEVNRSLEELHMIGRKILKSRREIREQNNDEESLKFLIDLLLEARDEETGTGLTDQELIDNVSTFLFAGSETTANTIVWMIHNLLCFPEIYEKLQNEIDEVLPEDLSKMTLQDISKLKFFNQVMNETMRWTPAVFGCPARFLKEDTRIGGYLCKAGSAISANIISTHLSPENFPEPDKFLPERWETKSESNETENERQLSSLRGNAFIPFGTGRRICIGKYFALLEIRVVLGSLLRKYKISKLQSETFPKIKKLQGPVLIPQGGLSIILEKRF